MAGTNRTKSDNLESMLINKTKKNFLQLNKLRLQKLAKEIAIKKKDESPKFSKPKIPKSLRPAKKGNFANESNAKKTSTSLAALLMAGDTKTSGLPKSKGEIKKTGQGTFKKNLNQIPSIEKKNQSVQSYNTDSEAFMKNAKVLTPSPHILAEIKQNKMMEVSKQKFVPSKRVFAIHEQKEEAHLDNLKEYLETGQISRRRKDSEQRREELGRKLGRYGKMTGSYSAPSSAFKSRRLTKHDIKYSLSTKMNTKENYPKKTDLAMEVGDTRKRNEDPRKLGRKYQRK